MKSFTAHQGFSTFNDLSSLAGKQVADFGDPGDELSPIVGPPLIGKPEPSQPEVMTPTKTYFMGVISHAIAEGDVQLPSKTQLEDKIDALRSRIDALEAEVRKWKQTLLQVDQQQEVVGLGQENKELYKRIKRSRLAINVL